MFSIVYSTCPRQANPNHLHPDPHHVHDSHLTRSQSLIQSGPGLSNRGMQQHPSPHEPSFGQRDREGSAMTASLTRKLSTCSQPPMHLQQPSYPHSNGTCLHYLYNYVELANALQEVPLDHPHQSKTLGYGLLKHDSCNCYTRHALDRLERSTREVVVR